jgi:hypothetical protein
MTLNEIKWIIESAAKYGLGGLVAGGILFLLLKNHISSYLTEKGKNLATKEDIGQITHLVKSVEHQYNVLIKQMEATQQLRMAAMDKRLEAHQQAFVLWTEVSSAAVDNGKIVPAVNKCKQWYYEHCLYLEPEVRTAFVDAFTEALHSNVLMGGGGKDEQKTASWATVNAFPDILFKAVQLPGISSTEVKNVTEEIPNLA